MILLYLTIGAVALAAGVLWALMRASSARARAEERLAYARVDEEARRDVERIKGVDRDRTATDALRDELLEARESGD